MNKKQLAKLLIKHPEIKALYESRAFDTSTINKVIAEEIMNEKLTDDQQSEIDRLTLQKQVLAQHAEEIKDDLKDAIEAGFKDEAKDLKAELAQVTTKYKNLTATIKAIEASAAKAIEQAASTETTDDDDQVAQTLQSVNSNMETAANAAKEDADVAAKVDGAAEAVASAAEAAKEGFGELGDIEVEDDEEEAGESGNDASDQEQTSNLETEFGTLQSIGEKNGREIFIGIEIPGLGKIPYYRSTGTGTGAESTGQIVPFLGFAQVFMQGYGNILGYFVKFEKDNPKLKVNFDKIPGRVSSGKKGLEDIDQGQLDLGDNSKAFNDLHKQLNNLQEDVKPGAKKLSEKVKEAYGENYHSKLLEILKILKLQTRLKNEGYLREDLVPDKYQLFLRDPIYLNNNVVLSAELQQEVSSEFSNTLANDEDVDNQDQSVQDPVGAAENELDGDEADAPASPNIEDLQSELEQVKEFIEFIEQNFVNEITPEDQKMIDDFKTKREQLEAQIEDLRSTLRSSTEQATSSNSEEEIEKITQAAKDVSQKLSSSVDTIKNPEASPEDKLNSVEQAVQDSIDTVEDDLEGIELEDGEENEQSDDASMTEKIQRYAESSSNYLSNVALASAGTALVAPPTAPVTIPVSKVAGWAGTAADVIALGAAIVNDDKEGMMKNGAATAIGVGAFFIPGGEGAKLLGKEAATETVKVAAKEGAETVTKEISKEVAEQIAKDLSVDVAKLATQEVTEQAIKAATEEVAKQAIVQTVAKGAITKSAKNIYAQTKEDGFFTSNSGEQFTEEELRQIGEAAIQKTAEKTAAQLENKTGDDFKSVTDKASEEVGMLDKIKSFFGFGSEEEIEDVENSTMTKPTDEQYEKLKDSWLNFKNGIKNNTGDNSIDNSKELLRRELGRRLQAYKKATTWSDLEELGHTTPEGATDATLKQWKDANMGKIEKYFGTDAETRIGNIGDSEELAKEIDSGVNATVEIENSINNVAANDDSAGDVGGAEVSNVDNFIAQFLTDKGSNIDQFPILFANDTFKDLFSKALQDASPEPSNNASGERVQADIEDAYVSNSPETINDWETEELEESLSGIYLAEEDEVSDTPAPTDDKKSGSPLSTVDAGKLRDEIQKLQGVLQQSEKDKVKTINVADLVKQAFGEIKDAESDEEPAPKTTEEAQQEGNEAAEIDSQKESATFAETYAKLIPSMDNFFSTEQATKLGFMEQFLLESQSAMLWDLIGNLTVIAEKGKARAFTKQQEKEESDISGEGSVEAEEAMQEGIGDFFKRDKEPVEISKEDQISLKTDLKALLQTLRATKVMVTSYEENMTRVSVDPGLDGSALKEQLDQYLPMVQKSIAKIVERANEAFVKATKLNAPKEEPEVTQPAEGDNAEEMDQDQMVEAILEAIAPALDGMHGLQEDNGRDETINFVDSVYNEMRAIYAPVAAGEDSEGLRGFMEAGNRAKAIKQAEAMLELATKEDFIKLFPGGRIGEGGMPATVKGAIGTLTREIKKLVMIMRDVVTLASKSTIPHSKLVEIVSSLTTISKALYNSFGAKMMISGETLEQIEERLGKDENNKSLTDTPSKPGLMDKVKQFGSKLFNKIKSWFQNNAGDVLNYLGDKFLDLFATKIEESGLDEDEQEEILTAMVEIVSWFDSLDNEKKIAVGMFGNNLIRIRGINEVSIPSIKKLGDEIETDKKKVLQAFMDLSKEQQSIIEDVMRTEREDLVNYLKEILRIKEKLGDEVAKELVGPTFGDDAGTSDDLSDEKPESDKQPTPNKVEQSLGWYQELEGSEREAAQAFATNFLNSLRKSNKVSYLVSESFSRRFSEKLAEIFDVEDLVDEMNQAINSVDGDLRKKVIKLMKESPEEFATFVYDLSTSDELGDKIFGEPEEKNSIRLPPELIKQGAKYRELEDLIGKVDKFFEKFYFGKSYEVRSTQMDLEELRSLEKQKKGVFLDWVWSIDKRLKKLSLKESEDKEHPADKMIKRIKAITKINIETSDFLDIINNALTDAVKRNDKGDSGSNNSLRSYWIGKINENPGKMAYRLGYFLNVYREHDINGLLELSSGKLSRSKPEEIEKMYLKVKNFDDGGDASGEDKKFEFDVQNVKPWNKSNPYKFGKKDSVEESLKPIIQKMLKEHYNY